MTGRVSRLTNRQSERLKKRFLESFAMTGNITLSCKTVGIGSRNTIYKWQEDDDAFASAYREAEISSTELMEAEAHRRGVLGYDKPVFQQGAQVGVIREYSDTLLIFMLKARNPDKYRDNANAGASGQPLVKGYPAEMLEKLA